MVNPNRLLIVAVLGLALIECGFSLLEGDTGDAAIAGLMFGALVFALAGFGGLVVYWLAMLVSWVLAASLPMLGLDLYLHSNQVPADGIADSYDWTMGSLILVVGLTGAGCHHYISHSHPSVNKNALDRELNALNVGLISGILFGLLANLMAIGFFVEGQWTFVEIIWIYWLDSVLIAGFGIWTVVKTERLDPRGTRYEHHEPSAIRRLVLENSLRGGAVFYVGYLALVTHVLGLPYLQNLGPLALVAVAFSASHYLEAEQRILGSGNRRLRLKRMQRVSFWRLAAMHFGLLLAFFSLVGGSEGAAVLFLLFKACIDVVIAVAQYRQFRVAALDSHPRLYIARRNARRRGRY